MAAELRERIARVIAPDAGWLLKYASGASQLRASKERQQAAAVALADQILALLPQPSPGEYGPLIAEARGRAAHNASDCPPMARMIHRLCDALSSALRERDKWKADYVAVQKVNADWSAYDKGMREAGKALVASALASPVNRISADMQQFWDAVQALRSALSLVVGEEDHG